MPVRLANLRRILCALVLWALAWAFAGLLPASAAVEAADPGEVMAAVLLEDLQAGASAAPSSGPEAQYGACCLHSPDTGEAESADRECVWPSHGIRVERPAARFLPRGLTQPQHAPAPPLRPPCARA
ncbi:hypothetical protein ACT80S_14050 [Ramlibacter sp. MAHUQ-53]|uniref:hypothetical protein n=1 Tax=unclassified Ramlibacter TaxID=2617605 RepID=UPI00362C0F9B